MSFQEKKMKRERERERCFRMLNAQIHMESKKEKERKKEKKTKPKPGVGKMCVWYDTRFKLQYISLSPPFCISFPLFPLSVRRINSIAHSPPPPSSRRRPLPSFLSPTIYILLRRTR